MLADGSTPGVPGIDGAAIDVLTSFWLGTVGGAELLGIPVGLLEVGRRFDAVLVDPRSGRSGIRVWPEVDDDARTFEKIVRLAGPDEILGVWVDGRRVVG
jgi:guanine deaminase